VHKSAHGAGASAADRTEIVNDRHQEGGAMAKNNKAGRKAKDLPIKSLAADQAKQVVGGVFAGGDKQKYMILKMSDVFISS